MAPKAFPSAYGFGAGATGGRGGDVVFVTNTNASGAGSLAAAYAASGARHIVPKVHGVVSPAAQITVTNPNLTYHGHLAPGGGLFLKKAGIGVDTGNAIIRYLRSFNGDELSSGVALHIMGATHKSDIIFDHCSVGWAPDQNMDAYGNFSGVTFQWNLVAESSDDIGQNFGSLIGRPVAYVSGAQTISLHHNIWVLNKSRNPSVLMFQTNVDGWIIPSVKVDYRNNLTYCWNGNNKNLFSRSFYNESSWNSFVAARGATGTIMEVNAIGNHWIKGPAASSEEDAFTVQENVKVYALNNIGPASTVTPVDGFNIKVTRFNRLWEGDAGGLSLHGTYTNTPYIAGSEYAFPEVPTHDATEIFNLLTQNAGAILPIKDALWTRLMNHVINGDGTFGEKLDYPTPGSGTYPTHSQPDGIPDAWKTANGLDTGTDYTGVLASDGYDWFEKYSHSMTGVDDGEGLRVLDPAGDPALAWDEQVGVSKTRVFVQWSGKKRWWEAPDAAGGLKADGSGVFNEIAVSPVILPAADLKFSIRQYDGSGDPLEAETDQIDWDNS